MDIIQNLILGLFIVLTVILIKAPKQQQQQYYWFLFNGIWIHIYLDGVVGYWQQHDWLFSKYSELDKRYYLKESTVIIVSAIEFYFMGPLCLWIALQIRQNRNHLLTLYMIGIISFIQVMGTIIFVYDEYARGFADVCPLGCYTLSISNIFYFWIFFVMANPVWLIVPLVQAKIAYSQLQSICNQRESKIKK